MNNEVFKKNVLTATVQGKLGPKLVLQRVHKAIIGAMHPVDYEKRNYRNRTLAMVSFLSTNLNAPYVH